MRISTSRGHRNLRDLPNAVDRQGLGKLLHTLGFFFSLSVAENEDAIDLRSYTNPHDTLVTSPIDGWIVSGAEDETGVRYYSAGTMAALSGRSSRKNGLWIGRKLRATMHKHNHAQLARAFIIT